MQNSTEQLLNTKSNRLHSVTSREVFHKKPVEGQDFIQHDYNNLYRTSYNDMTQKFPKLENTHFIPGYKGFVPGLVSENPIASNITRLSKEQINSHDKKRFTGNDSSDYKQWKYNPLSKTHGNFFKTNPELHMQKTLVSHDFTGKLKDSGYSVNHFTFDRTGWLAHPTLHSDQKRTEYRIQYNTKKEIHYKGPRFCTGELKKKELNYRHT